MNDKTVNQLLKFVADNGISDPVIYCHPEDAEQLEAPEMVLWEKRTNQMIKQGDFLVGSAAKFDLTAPLQI